MSGKQVKDACRKLGRKAAVAFRRVVRPIPTDDRAGCARRESGEEERDKQKVIKKESDACTWQ